MHKHESAFTKRIIRAIILSIAASLCHSIMTLLVKLISPQVTANMTVFFRFLVSSLWIILVLFYKHLQGKRFPIKTHNFKLHLLRAICSFVAIWALYYSLKYTSLANATSLVMTYSLFIPLLGFLFFGIRTSGKSCLALFAGFVGVIFILKPYANNFDPRILIALVAGIATSCSLLGVYELAKKEEPYTIMLYFFPLSFILSCVFVTFTWRTPDMHTLMILLIAGVMGTAYHEFVTRAALYAHPKISAPALYFNIIFSSFFDWIFWQHIPDVCFWLGALLIILGCIFSIKHASAANS